jgi:hypothetical protein
MILQALGHEKVTGLGSVQILHPPAGVQRAWIVCTGMFNVRWRDDGVDPTPTVGIVLSPGVPFWYEGNVYEIRMIEEDAAKFVPTVVDVSYYA